MGSILSKRKSAQDLSPSESPRVPKLQPKTTTLSTMNVETLNLDRGIEFPLATTLYVLEDVLLSSLLDHCLERGRWS
jgi:hypothetical protein